MYTKFIERGWPVFPINRETKKPLVAWKPFQTTLPRLDLACAWEMEHPLARCNIGLATGALSGLVVVDIDSEDGLAELSKHGFCGRTWSVKTGRGEHLYFKHPGFDLGNKAGFVSGVDLRADGGYVVIPPSVHSSGRKYEWVVGPDDLPEPAAMPEWLILLVNPPQEKRTNGNRAGEPLPDRAEHWLTKFAGQATIGTRNVNLYNMGLQLHADGVSPGEAESIARQYVGMVGADKSFTERDAEKTMRSAYSGEPFQPAALPGQHNPVQRALSLAPNAVVMPSAPQADYTDLPADPLFIDEKHMLQETMDMLLSVPEAMPKYPPVLFPINLLHQLGGNAHYTLRGQLIYIMAAPGDGKTSFAEYCAARIRQRGQDVIWYSPEWGRKMTLRSLQRFGGPTIDDVSAHQIDYAEKLKGVPAVQRAGQPLAQEQVNAGVKIMADLMRWPGKAYHIVKASLTFDELVGRTIAAIEYSRKQGGDPAWVIWDYLEVLRRYGSNDAFWGEGIADVFQAIGVDHGVVPVLLHQPKKQAGDDVQNAAANDKSLTDVLLHGGSGQGIGSQKCNLGITINPYRDENGSPVSYDREGNPTGMALINVYKNSTARVGYGGQAIAITTDFAHLTFIDDLHSSA